MKKNEFKRVYMNDQLGRAYLFEGPHSPEKANFLSWLLKLVVCTDVHEGEPCGNCLDCKLVEAGSHPDVSFIVPEKTEVTVGEIRTQYVASMALSPYRSNKKIYVIPNAERLSIPCQNAMLKTMEDSPEYGLTILMAHNSGTILPTVKSRCLISKFVTFQNKYEEAKNLLAADELAEEDSVIVESRAQAIKYFKQYLKGNFAETILLAREMTATGTSKEELIHIYNYWYFIYMDIMHLKVNGTEPTYYPDEMEFLTEVAKNMNERQIAMCVRYTQEHRNHLNTNMSTRMNTRELLLALKQA